MPEIISFLVSVEDEFIADVIARAHTCFRVFAVLLLQLRIELLIDYRHFHFMSHSQMIT